MKLAHILVVLQLGIALQAPSCGAPVQEKKKQSACSNDIVILTCKKSCQDIGSPVWMKDGDILRDKNTTRYSMKSFDEHYELYLLKASVNDSGDYDCQVHTPNFTRSEVTTLDVKGEEECRIIKEKHDFDRVKQYLDTFKAEFMKVLYAILVLIIIPQWFKNKMSDICKRYFEKLSTFVCKRDDRPPPVQVSCYDAEDVDLLPNPDTSSQTQHAEIEMGILDGNKESLPSSTVDSAEGDEISSLA